MRIPIIVLIAISISLGIIGAVFVVGGMYQQELFEEYMEDVKNPTQRNLGTTVVLPADTP